MKKAVLAVLCALALSPSASFATEVPRHQPTAARDARNSLYLELGGNAGLYSLNYERYVADDATLRLGGSYFSVTATNGFDDASASVLLVPITASWLGVGSGAHRLELGGGVVVAHVSARVDSNVDSSFVEGSGTGILGTGIFGYRYARTNGGFLFRAGFTPLFGEGGFLPWFGVSAGAGF